MPSCSRRSTSSASTRAASAPATRSTCTGTKQLDALIASDPDPDTAAETAHSDELLTRLGKGCLRESGALVRHMSTVEVAKDVDVLRAALGDRKLTYFGASYGTAIGATYAGLFPGRVGRMVLDGALDPSISSVQQSLIQAKGFEVALRAYVGACVDRGGCFLGDSVDAGTGGSAGSSTTSRRSRCTGTATRSSSPATPCSVSGCRSTTRATGRSWTRRCSPRSPATAPS